MTAVPWTCVVCCFSLGLLLTTSLPYAEGVEVEGLTYDLQVQSVSQSSIEVQGEEKIVLAVEFTASTQPQIQWAYGVNLETVYADDTQLSYSGGQGRATATFGSTLLRVTLKIGYLDAHYLSIHIKMQLTDDVARLNTGMSTLSPGYDISYTRGESFQVTASIPTQIAEGFTLARKMSDPNEYTISLDACYVDQSSGHVLSSVDYIDNPDMSTFLQWTKTISEDSASWVLDFNTTRVDVTGYFRLFNLYGHPGFSLDNFNFDALIYTIWETMNIQVHNASTPGPFPYRYADIRTGWNPKRCSRGNKCSVYCYGYANNITQVSIYKEGAAEPLQEGVYVNFQNSNNVNFNAKFMASGDYAGNYVCRIASSDGTTAEGTVRVIGD